MQEKISFNETVFFDKIKIALQRLESDTDAKLRSLMTSEANSKTVTDFGDPIKKFKDIVKIYGINGTTVSKKDFPDEIYAAVMQRVVAVEAPKFSGGSLNEGYIIKQLGAYISDLLDTKTETITVGNKNYTLSNPIGSTLSTITVTVNDAHYVFSWNDDATARKSLNIFMKNLAEFEKEQLTSIFFAILKDAKKFTTSSDGNSSDTLSKWLNALMHGRKTKSLSNLNGFEYFRQLSLVTKSTSVPGELISLVTDVFDTLKPALEVYGKLKSPNKQAKKLLETIESVRGTAESVKKFMSFTKDIFTDNGGTISSLIDKYDNLLEKTTTLAAYIDEHEISSAETLAASSAYKNFVKDFNNLESVAGVSTTSFAVVLDECKVCEFSDVTTAEISQNRALINGNGDDNNILAKGTSVTLNGNAGDDTLMTSGGYACVNGGDGADSIISEGRYSEINGNAGNDFIQIKGNGSSVNGGTGSDTLLIDAANVTVDGGTNFDFLPVPDKIIVGSNAEDLLIKNFEYADTLDLSEYKIGELSAGKYQTNSLEIWSRTTHKTIAILEDVTGGTDNNILCTGNDYLFTAVSLDWLLANTPTIANPYATLKPSSVVNVPINGTVNNTVDNVIVCAQSGNNSINNTGYAVVIDGGTGNDTIDNGGYYNEVYYNGDFSTISGGEGSDLITNYIGRNVTIAGGVDNDSIYNYSDSVSIYGGAGNDSICNSYDVEHVTINGGDGNDSIYNYEGSNVIISGGDGDDYIGNYYSNNVSIDGGAGDDTFTNNADNSTITGGEGNDSIYNRGSNVLIFTGDGNNTIENFGTSSGDGSNVLIISGIGFDSITNRGKNVLLISNAGNDTIRNIADTVSISAGDGDDSIDNGRGSTVTIDGGAGDDRIESNGDNVLIDGGAGNDSIKNEGGSNVTISGGDGADTIYNDHPYVAVDGGTGDDYIDNRYYGEHVTIEAGTGNDSIYSNNDNVKISVGDGNDSINNHSYYATIEGGLGDDIIDQHARNGLFKYKEGDGNDKIFGFYVDDTLSISGAAYSSVVSGNDLILTVGNGKITLYGAATLSSVHIDGTLTTSSANVGLTADSTVSNTIISGTSYADSIKNTGNKVTINANADNDTINNVGSSVRIDAGNGNDRVYNNSTGVFINGNEDDDYIENGYYGIASDTTIDGGTGNDTIWNGETKVSINGNDGNDSVYSYAPEVTISGGAGSDTLWNDWGQVVLFKYAAGDGNDTIQGFNASSTLQISGSEYSSAISGDDVIITVGDGSILLVGAKDMTINIETVEGADNTILTLDNKTSATVELKASEEIANASKRTKPIQLTGNARNNELIGGNGNDTLDGAGGNNTLTSGKGKDTFIYNGGKDIITDYDKKDKIDTGSLAHEGFTVDGKDLIFNFGDGKALTLQDGVGEVINMNSNSNVYTSDGILDGKKKEITLLDTVTTFDATSANVYSKAVTIDASAASNEISITGNKKKNYIVAGANGATLNGGKGNDTLVGGVGADIFVYENKSGKDVIKGFGDGDSISLTGAEIKDAKVKGDNATIKFKGGALTINGTTEFSFMQDGAEKKFSAGVFVEEDTAKVYGSFKGSLKLADHDVANFNGSLGKKKLTITGDDSSNSLVGGKGKDSLNGGAGADSLWGGKGNDTLLGGDGDDTFIFNAGGGKDIIADYTTGDMIKILDKKGGDGSFTKATFKDDSLTLNVKGGGKVIVSGVNFSTVVNINSTNQTVSNLINSL